jgi:ArsR family transcriptional regulator
VKLALLLINSQRGTMARNRRQDPEAEVFERQAIICKAFANPTRLHLLDLLGKGERSLADVQQVLGISKANLSQHLAVLKAAGVVTTHRDGKHVYAMLAIPEVKQACHLIREVLRGHMREQNRMRVAP